MNDARAKVGVDVFADLSCPWCYVGWNALKRAARDVKDDISASVTWRTFLLAPDMAPEGLDRKAYLSERYPPERLRAAHEVLEASAAELDLPLDLDAATRLPSTIDAHRLVHWAAAQGLAEAAIDGAFHAYFVEGQDIGAHDVLMRIAESIGLDPGEIAPLLASDKDRDTVRAFHIAARQIGVTGVPVAVFNRASPLMGAQIVETYADALRAAAR